MHSRKVSLTRRASLVRITEFVGLVAVTAVAGRSMPVAAKAAKSDFMYQDHRHDGKSCSQCKFYAPDGLNSDTGSCSIVAGAVSREGWCTAFAPKVLA